MAMMHLIYHGSERIHNYFRSSGGADEEQKRKFGKVLWRTYKRMMKTANGLAPDVEFGGIFTSDPTEPPGAILDSAGMVLQAVVDDFGFADLAESVDEAVVMILPAADPEACSALGPVPEAALPGSSTLLQAEAVLTHALSSTDFDAQRDVKMTATAWLDKPTGACAIFVVCVFNWTIENAGLAQDGPERADKLVEAVAAWSAGTPFLTRFGAFFVYSGNCFSCFDGALQYRISMMREGKKTNLISRCTAVEGVEHAPDLTIVGGTFGGDDHRPNLQSMLRLRWKLSNPKAGQLSFSANGETATRTLQPMLLRSTGEGSGQLVNPAGDVVLVSELPWIARHAQGLLACGMGYPTDGVVHVECKGHKPVTGLAFAGTAVIDPISGAVIGITATERGHGHAKSATKCSLRYEPPAGGGGAVAKVCELVPTVSMVGGKIIGMRLVGKKFDFGTRYGDSSFGVTVPAGVHAFEMLIGWGVPFSYEDLQCAGAIVPVCAEGYSDPSPRFPPEASVGLVLSVDRSGRVLAAALPSASGWLEVQWRGKPPAEGVYAITKLGGVGEVVELANLDNVFINPATGPVAHRYCAVPLHPRRAEHMCGMTLDSAAAGEERGRDTAVAEVGCNIDNHAGQRELRNPKLQLNSATVTDEEYLLWAPQGEFTTGLTECTTLFKAETRLRPLFLVLHDLSMQLQEAYHGHREGQPVLPLALEVRAAAQRVNEVAQKMKDGNTRKKLEIASYSNEALLAASDLLTSLADPVVVTPAPDPALTADAQVTDDSDPVRGEARGMDYFQVGDRIIDRILGAGKPNPNPSPNPNPNPSPNPNPNPHPNANPNPNPNPNQGARGHGGGGGAHACGGAGGSGPGRGESQGRVRGGGEAGQGQGQG